MLAYLCQLSLTAQFASVRSLRLYILFISVLLSSAFYRAGVQTRDVDPMLAHCLQCWANINPVLGYHVVFGATLNVGQRHRQRANINPALVQSILPVPPACRYRQHEVLTVTEWILASTGDAGPALDRCRLVIAASSKQYQLLLNAAQQTWGVKPVLVWCWASVADDGLALDQHRVNVVFAGSVDKPHYIVFCIKTE